MRTAATQGGEVKYTYVAVTACGHGVHGGPHSSLKRARDTVERLRERGWSDAEVERIAELDNGARRYWLQRKGRWVLWDDVVRKD
jgi:iron only hydrogenase large subunit-like protein